MKLSFITILLTFFVFSVATAQKEDKKKTNTSIQTEPTEGVVYALPQTGIRVYVTATRERFIPGPFSVYASKMLGIENVPSLNADYWNLSDLKIVTFSEPDPMQVHKAMGKSAGTLCLTESGILAGVNTSVSHSTEPFLLQSLPSKPADRQTSFTDLSIAGFYNAGDSLNRFRMVSKTPEQKAIEAAETIFKLRNARFSLLTNANDEPLPDGKSFEVMALELGKLEENYVALFVGKSTKQNFDFSFDLIPGSKTMKGEVVFRFSDDKGVLPKSDLSGRPIMVDVVKDEDLATKQAGLSSSENPNAGKSGLYYRMPGAADIKLYDGSTQLARKPATIAQFGTVASLPEDLLDGSYKIEFYPGTGAIKSILEINKMLEILK